KAEKQPQIISDDDLYNYSYNEDETLNDILNREDSDITVQSIESSIALTSNSNTSSSNILNETISNTNTSSNILNETSSKKLRKKGTSWVWKYMEICQNKIICLECQKNLPSNQTQPTSFQLHTGTRNMNQTDPYPNNQQLLT
ncbi:1001_t:CDS:1, partial [Scutellospora calospora]